jgi:hypothetical protein
MEKPMQRIARPRNEHRKGLDIQDDIRHNESREVQIAEEQKPEEQGEAEMELRHGHAINA